MNRPSINQPCRGLAVLAALLLVFMLAGCPQAGTPEESAGGNTPAPRESPPAVDEQTGGTPSVGVEEAAEEPEAATPEPEATQPAPEPEPEPQPEPTPVPPEGTEPEPEPPSGGPSTPGLLEGPGFTLTIPPGFVLYEDGTSIPAYSFWRYYGSQYSNTGIGVGVLPPSAVGGGSTYEDITMRVKGAYVTGTGDFLLIIRAMTDRYFGDEFEGALGLLADGSRLIVLVGSPFFSGEEEGIANLLFASIDMEGTTGWELEDAWRETAPKVRLVTDNRLVLLEDLSVWELPWDATYNDESEVASWQAGDAVFPQRVNEYFQDHDELVHVGHWRPVEMDYLGFAEEETIAAIVDWQTIELSDGSWWGFLGAIPAGWDVGDRVFIVEMALSGKWLIHEETATAIEFY